MVISIMHLSFSLMVISIIKGTFKGLEHASHVSKILLRKKKLVVPDSQWHLDIHNNIADAGDFYREGSCRAAVQEFHPGL